MKTLNWKDQVGTIAAKEGRCYIVCEECGERKPVLIGIGGMDDDGVFHRAEVCVTCIESALSLSRSEGA